MHPHRPACAPRASTHIARRSPRASRLLAALGLALALSGFAQAAPVLWIADESGQLARVDIASGAVRAPHNMGVRLSDIAFDPEGRLFGITYDAQLFRVDPGTGSATRVGELGASIKD